MLHKLAKGDLAMSDDLVRYVHYRNSAEALRMTADISESPTARRARLALAKDYDQFANVLEDLIRSEKITVLGL